MILDDDKLSSIDNNLKISKTYKSETSILNNTTNNTNKEFFSYKKLRAKERRNLSSSKKNKDPYYDPPSRKNSVANLSDLESASQIPINLQNPSYLFEEQEGSVDLRSEYSYCAKNNIMGTVHVSQCTHMTSTPRRRQYATVEKVHSKLGLACAPTPSAPVAVSQCTHIAHAPATISQCTQSTSRD